MTEENYLEWSREAGVLAQIGLALARQGLRVAVRLPKDLADQAVAAWERGGSEAEVRSETPEQRAIRHRAGTLGLIGLTIQRDGLADGDDVAVDLDAWYIGQALDAADNDGLLVEIRPPSSR